MKLASPRAFLPCLIAAFLGLAAVAHAQPGRVAVFDNGNYVDNDQNSAFEAEGPNTIASLQSFGETTNVFTGTTAADFTTALAGQDSLVIPELENDEGPPCLSDDMGADGRDVVNKFVAGGGQLVVMSVGRNACNDKFVNSIFGFAVDQSVTSATRGGNGDIYNKTPDAAGTEWADAIASIPENNGTIGIHDTTLPAGAKPIYDDGNGLSAVVDIPFGDGSVTLLGWDWYDSSPPNPVLASGPVFDGATRQRLRGPVLTQGGQDFGWQDVLRRSVDLPVIASSDVSLNEGNSGTTPFNFGITASSNHSEVLHVGFGTANGTATAPSDYTATSGTLTFQRTDNALGVGVPVIGDTAVEPNETFTLGLAAAQTPAPYAIGKGGTGTIVNDDVLPAKPKVGVAGVRRACTSSSRVHVRFSITAPGGVKSVTISLDGKRVTRTTKSRFTITVNAKKLKAGRHTITAVAIDNSAQKTTVRKTIARCAAAKPRRQTGPRFTG
jgi:hypothetical protein